MEAEYVDRILTCVECRSEFVFTAGEQLFFSDKQFKNDPKRCKPCKSRRSGLTAAANGTGPAAAGISRTETRTECSECGVQTTVPFKPTQGRPVLCRQCFQVKAKGVAIAASAASAALPTTHTSAGLIEAAPVQRVGALAEPATTAETVTALTAASANRNGEKLSLEAAQLAVATMAAAAPDSSVATMADLQSILPSPEAGLASRGYKNGATIPELLAAAQGDRTCSAVALIADLPEISD